MGIPEQASERSLTRVICGVAFGLTVSTSGWAAANTPSFGFQTQFSIQSIGEAFRTLAADPGVQGILSNPAQEIQFIGQSRSDELSTLRFQSYYKGLEVFGAQALLHEGVLGSDVTHALQSFDLDITPALSEADAILLARSLHGGSPLAGRPALKVLPDEDQDAARLIYWVTLQGYETEPGYEVLIDAHSGAVIADISQHLEIAPIEVYSAAEPGAQDLDPRSGAPTRFNPEKMGHPVVRGTIQPGADDSARRAMENSARVLNYYLTEHQRDGFDDKGSPSISIVHAGKGFSNAFWSSGQNIMAYGDGDGVRTKDFTRGIDVAGHEMTHGVVQETADLAYFSESGALNEAFADFFGKMIEGKEDWVLGKEIFLKPEEASRGIRNLATPGALSSYTQDDEGRLVKRPYPSTMAEKFTAKGGCNGSNDRCYVHINSTIPGHAAYRIYGEIGRQDTQKLMYLVLTQYLTPRSGFRNFGSAMLKACGQTLDTGACEKVRTQLTAVGLL